MNLKLSSNIPKLCHLCRYGKKLKKRFTASMTVSNEDEIQLQETMKLNSKWEIPREKVIINRRLGEGIIIVVVMDDAAFTITPNINIS